MRWHAMIGFERRVGIGVVTVCCVALGGCGGVQQVEGAASQQAVLDARDHAQLAVERLWQDTYRACERLDVAGCTAIYADGPDTLILGTAPDEAVLGHDAIVERWKQQLVLPPGTTLHIATRGLTATPSQDAQSAWTDDVVTWEQHDPDGHVETDTVRQTSVVEKIDGRWRVVLVHDSFPIADDQAIALSRAGKLIAPTPLRGTVARGAEAAAKLVRDSLADPIVWEGAIDKDDDDAYGIGSAPDDLLRGGRAIREKIAAERVHYRFTYSPLGGLRAGITHSGNVAWIATSFAIGGRQAGQPFSVPLRLTFVLEKRDGSWRIVQQHLSVGLSLDQIAMLQAGG